MTDERLSQLLKLKSSERPSQDFWDAFDRTMERKCLRELCVPSSMWTRLKHFLFSRKCLSSFSIAAAGMALAIINFRSPLSLPQASTSSSVAMTWSPSPREYIQDILGTPQPTKVLSSDIISSKMSSSRYVCDLVVHTPNHSCDTMTSSALACF
ncbi:MAG: hypothetical protein LBD40_00390 [Puniceicoccales bacterium]|nr:hypothetical protein [Puniceicoccales bacterium]